MLPPYKEEMGYSMEDRREDDQTPVALRGLFGSMHEKRMEVISI